ncbi:MinD/ParA family protein [Tepidimicrobium xylanilyticum]|uniref:Flagellar biosynthesis protein FlhG n=1 Tax=Tepidimicrobium xylanilyticum TaxID=1123352 RepID=A0A1H2YEB4_9FIRM|nr:MinD/ParA family protein [Tepidimicrobium xylanilyticum]GMG97120.1 site-determining protein [Tepidimicrobium xylanilyticum]SDX03543.1 flagellar biosynthesis protein FlhG [Tepidimicrobium xylanilyticum]
MKDQAERLRQIMKNKDELNKSISNKAKVLAVTSGKGGVGKTNFALNLAISIKRLGHKVLVLDADLGLANVEILSGTNVKFTIFDFIIGEKSINEIIATGPEGIKLISGGSGLEGLSVMDENNINRLIKELEGLESSTDFIIIDTGAGISGVVTNFVMAADEVIIITTPDPTAVMDAYTMIKTLVNNGYNGRINVVANIVNNKKEAISTFNRLNLVADNFLKIKLNFLGYLERNTAVDNAVKKQIPFLLSNPKSSISKKINVMALKFVESNNDIKDNSFTGRLKKLLVRRGGL